MILDSERVETWTKMVKAIQTVYYNKKRMIKFFEKAGMKFEDLSFDYFAAGQGDIVFNLFDLYREMPNMEIIYKFETKMSVGVALYLPKDLAQDLFLGNGTNEERIKNFLNTINRKEET